MTTSATGRPVTDRAAGHYINRTHTVTGTATQLANIVTNHRDAGTLISVGKPRPLPGDRFELVVRLYEYQPTRPSVRVHSVGERARTRIRRSRRTRTAVLITTITGTVAGLVAVAAYLLGQLVELIVAHAGLILVVLALIAALAAATRRRSSGRRHCPGC